jgi:hypothetical protein
MPRTREKFATQVNSEILSAVRALAAKEGRQLQALVDEALADLIEKRRKATPRARYGRLPRQPRRIRSALQEAR